MRPLTKRLLEKKRSTPSLRALYDKVSVLYQHTTRAPTLSLMLSVRDEKEFSFMLKLMQSTYFNIFHKAKLFPSAFNLVANKSLNVVLKWKRKIKE